MPPFYGPGATGTPTPQVLIKRLDGVYVWVDWNSVVDWSKLDIVDLVVDGSGILGDAVSGLGLPGRVVWGISEIPEGVGEAINLVGLSKNAWDLVTEKDPSGLSLTAAQESFERTLVGGLKLFPNAGWVFNVISLGMNIGPNIHPEAVHIIH